MAAIPTKLVAAQQVKIKGRIYGAGDLVKRQKTATEKTPKDVLIASDEEVRHWMARGILMDKAAWDKRIDQAAAEAAARQGNDDPDDPELTKTTE